MKTATTLALLGGITLTLAACSSNGGNTGNTSYNTSGSGAATSGIAQQTDTGGNIAFTNASATTTSVALSSEAASPLVTASSASTAASVSSVSRLPTSQVPTKLPNTGAGAMR